MKKTRRRQFLSMLGLGSIGIGATGLSPKAAQAHHTETHFDDASPHKLVYQLNQADEHYIESVLFSCGEMLRKYNDDIELVVTVIGPGIHLLAVNPQRPIKAIHKQRVQSLIDYGVRFEACGNTLKGLQWTDIDIIDDAVIVPIGYDSIMQRQEQGFSYIAM